MTTLLVIDDNEHTLQLLNLRLTRLGYDVKLAGDGFQALSILNMYPADLVLLDQSMPQIDGLTTLARIQEIAAPFPPPIIMMTAFSSVHLAVDFMQSGGADFVEKPIDFEVLDIKIQRAILMANRLKDEVIKRKQAEAAREKLIQELQESLEQIKTLSGMLPICANCKSIRDDKGYWERVETYISKHTDANFTHGICPDCSKALYPGL